ncbi:MAG: choice-of-anchor I family protein [bacterium]|nr:choice-of-anchor I family protein [bacterium]
MTVAAAHPTIELVPLGTYATGIYAAGAAEIVAHDPVSQRLYVVNGAGRSIDVLDMSDPANLLLLFSIDLSPYGQAANSVAVHNGVVCAAVENVDKQAPGSAVFFDTDGKFLKKVTVGALPDMVTFSPNGNWVLIANEGEPDDDYTNDPEGSVSIIDMRFGVSGLTQESVRTAGFNTFNDTVLDPSVRIFGPGAPVAEDMEPEYITISQDSRTAWVTLQENNALAIIDIHESRVTDIVGLGFKDWNLPGNTLDASNEDAGINITNWPVLGMYLPDSIASYQVKGETFIITANEGDSRDYSGFSEEARVKDILLDPDYFQNAAELQDKARLGRLKITTTRGDADGDGEFEALYAYGARSFSIWTADGIQVFDSGGELEQVTADYYPDVFNSDEEYDTFDGRSDDKGPEPEGLVIGRAFGRVYAFVGLERIGGIMVYNVSDPAAPYFVQYINTRNFSRDPLIEPAGNVSPEGICYIKAENSPTGNPLLTVAYEISGTTTVFEVREKILP